MKKILFTMVLVLLLFLVVPCSAQTVMYDSWGRPLGVRMEFGGERSRGCESPVVVILPPQKSAFESGMDAMERTQRIMDGSGRRHEERQKRRRQMR